MPPEAQFVVPPGSSRRWRRALWVLAALFTLAALVLLVAARVLSRLDDPAIKSRIQSLAHGAGIDLDYAHARLSVGSGLHIEGLSIGTPAALRAYAPELVHIGSVDVVWAPSRLVHSGARIDSVAVHDVSVTIVLDESGRTSFDFGTTPATPAPAAAPKPRSRLLDDLLGSPLPLRAASIDPIAVTVVRTAKGAVVERHRVEGLRLEASTEAKGVQLRAGSPTAPLRLQLSREGTPSGKAELGLSVAASADPDHAGAKLTLDLLSQSIDPVLAPLVGRGHALALDAEARFEHKAGRVVVAIKQAEAAGGALRLDGQLALPDTGAPLVQALDAHVDVPRVLALAPPSIAPSLPRVTSGQIDVHAEQVSLATTPKVQPGGALRATIALHGARAQHEGLEAELPSLSAELNGAPDGAVAGHLTVELAHAGLRKPALRLDLDGGKLTAKWRELVVDPVALAGKVELELALQHARVTAGEWTGDGSALRLEAKSSLSTRPPYGAVLGLHGQRLGLLRGGRSVFDDALDVELRLSEVVPDLANLGASRGALHVQSHLGAIALTLDGKKAADSVDYDLKLEAPQLGALERLLGPAARRDVPWAKMGLRLHSAGRVEPWALRVRHDTSIELLRPALGTRVAADALSLSLRSSGTTRKHEGDLVLAVNALRREHHEVGDGTVTTHFALDADAPSLSAELGASGTAAPELRAKLKLGFDRGRRRLDFDLDAGLHKLDPLAPVLAAFRAVRGFRMAGLSLELSAHGAVADLVEAIDRTGAIRLNGDPLGAHGEATLSLKTRGLFWQDQDRAVDAPQLDWKGSLKAEGIRRELKAELHLPALHLAIGPTRIDLAELGDELRISLDGDPRKLQIAVEDKMRLHGLRQELVPEYRTADLSLTLRATHASGGVIRVPELRVENPAAGTSILLQGGLDLGEDRRSLSMRGTLSQDLARLWNAPQQLVARGTLSTEVNVESGDLRRYRTSSSVRLKDGHLELPRQKIKLESVDGEIPLAAEVRFAADGLKLSRNTEVNSYSELRFSDQHPLLSRRSYLSIAKVETPWATIAPLAGNLVVDNNLLSMSQLELGLRGGRVTGRAVLALQGADSKAQLNIRASDVRSSRGEPFDGNAAIGISVRQRSVQGRAEILRIGRRHLLDLLDVADPPRTDAAINRVRRALALGYPDQVRLSFSRGFASAKITFGGIAKLVHLDEIRGIPLGPIIDRVLAPFFDDEEEP